MNSRRRIVALLAILIIAVLATRVRYHARRTRVAIAALQSSCAALRGKIITVQTQLAALRSAITALDRAIDAAEATDATNAAAPAQGAGAPGDSSTRISAATYIFSDPKRRAEYREAYRGGVEWDYGALLHALGANAEQIEKFKDVEYSLFETLKDLDAAIELHQLDPHGPEIQKIWNQYNRDRVAKKEAALGDLLKPYLEYFRTRDIREHVTELAYFSVFSGEPITAGQIFKAGEILATNTPHHGMNDKTKKGPWAYAEDVNWDSARPQLAALLSPSQLEMLGLLFARESAHARSNDAIRRIQSRFKSQFPAK